MIAYLNGKIVVKADNFAIIEANDVGYEAYFSQKNFQDLSDKGSQVEVFCHLELNERGVKLFGFLTFDELELFKVIRNIQGVGPKAALEISSVGSLQKVKELLEKGSINFLDGMPGIGPKKSQKIILELSGQIKNISSLSKKEKELLENDEAYLALIKLGFAKEKAKKAILELPKEIKDTQQRVKKSLQILGGAVK